MIGENLALYRTEAGGFGLVAQRCPHRNAFFTDAGGMVSQPEAYAENPLAFVRGSR